MSDNVLLRHNLNFCQVYVIGSVLVSIFIFSSFLSKFPALIFDNHFEQSLNHVLHMCSVSIHTCWNYPAAALLTWTVRHCPSPLDPGVFQHSVWTVSCRFITDGARRLHLL